MPFRGRPDGENGLTLKEDHDFPAPDAAEKNDPSFCFEMDVHELLRIVREYLTAAKAPQFPQELLKDESFASVIDDLSVLRDVLSHFSRGDLAYRVKGRGFLMGCLKELQAHLRHLTWHAERLANGDFAQRVEFMGNFADSFNAMASRLYETMNALRENESHLLSLTEELHASEERWKLAVTCSQDGIWDIDIETRRAYFSPRLLEILRGIEKEAETTFDAEKWRRHILPDDLPVWDDVMNKVNGTSGESDQHYFELRLRGDDGRYRWIGAHYLLICDAQGRPNRFVGAIEDIQERRERDDAIRIQATHDNLTGLPNRYLYNDRLAQQMVMAKRIQGALIMVVWDLDSFKAINDTFGHLVGDQLLRGVARTMASCLREVDTLARFGGDEFVMLLSCPRGEECNVAAHTTARIFEALRIPIDIGEVSVIARASCGISYYPKHATEAEALFELADKALYMAKRAGKNRAQVWIPPENEE